MHALLTSMCIFLHHIRSDNYLPSLTHFYPSGLSKNIDRRDRGGYGNRGENDGRGYRDRGDRDRGEYRGRSDRDYDDRRGRDRRDRY